ncbi:MAG: AMP-binding protein, partial [bacterium]|nr:AMP-binding protein [bacterium]
MNESKNIDKKNVDDILALTPMQEGMLFYYLKEPGSEQYFEQLFLEMEGEMERGVFEKAWTSVVDTNEMLRTLFRWEKVDNPVQVILKEHPPQLRFFDLSEMEADNKKENLDKIKKDDRQDKFRLTDVPFRVTLVVMGENAYHMIISSHHILYDGWSNGIILKEFFRAYNHIDNGKEPLRPVKSKYKEFVKHVGDRDKKKQEAYWREYLEGFEVEKTLLSGTGLSHEIKGTGPPVEETISIEEFTFSRDAVAGMRNAAEQHKTTVAALLYGAWGLLLQRYYGREDVLFGITVSGRNAKIADIEDMVGLFINTLPLRVKTEDETLWELLDNLQRTLSQMEVYESTPLLEIKQYMKTMEELFDSIVVIENYPLDTLLTDSTNRLRAVSYSLFARTSFNLTVGITIAGGIRVQLFYNSGVITGDMVKRMVRHFETIASEFTGNDRNKNVREIDMISSGERHEILYEFNGNRSDFPGDKSVCHYLERHSAEMPDRAAISIAGETLTYGRLNRWANQLAEVLAGYGMGKDRSAGILLERSISTVVTILAIWKAGGAYIPIDTRYPADRVKGILADSGSLLLVTHSRYVQPGLEKDLECPVLRLDEEEENIRRCDTANPCRL